MMLTPGTRLGRYEIRSKLGAGGMGEVYLALDTKLDRKVALKILPEDVATDHNRMKRFVQEAKAASALNHPNIITIHEIDRNDSLHFIATEFIDGETLRERIRRAPLKLSEVLDVATQVAGALAAAHAVGIVHRDIKPENIMLRQDGIVKVLDFGLAKLSEPPAVAGGFAVDTEAPTRPAINTEPGVVMGTAIYMSPEQARGLPVDARTDIFSLGVLIYEMVTGNLPFDGSNTYEIIASILHDKEAEPLARYACEAPAELERIIAKTLRKNRDERYQNSKDLLLDLKSLRERRAFEAELERSAASRERAAGDAFSASAAGDKALAQFNLPTADSAQVPRPASSAEYLFGSIRRNKLASLITLIVIAGIVGVSLYLRGLSSDAIESIAVLPFVNVNNDPNTEYLSDGIPETIINSLSQLPNLKVMSSNSVFHYKGKEINAQTVARELNVQAVLTGRLMQHGDGLTISVELINPQDNSQIWGQQYNRQLADMFAVQEEIAKEVSEKLRLKLSGAEKKQLGRRPTDNIKAFQYYMQGRMHIQRRTRDDLLTAIRYYQRAIEEDPSYALAYAGLAEAHGSLGVRGHIAPIEGRRKMEEAARTALELDQNLAEAHVMLGGAYVVFAPYNFSQGEPELLRAIELSPSLAVAHQFLGHSLLQQGRFDESLAAYSKARELDPLSSVIARAVAIPYYMKRDYARSLELLRQANELGPPFITFWEIGAYIQTRSFDEALRELEKAKRERKNDPILIYSTGMVHAARGERAKALQIIDILEKMSGPGQQSATSLSQAFYIGKIYAALNENELALAWLERGFAAGAIGGFDKNDPGWNAIRSDPRFTDLVRRMGLR
jgi:serine/threonine protein kinase/lipoprotein NlpI